MTIETIALIIIAIGTTVVAFASVWTRLHVSDETIARIKYQAEYKSNEVERKKDTKEVLSEVGQVKIIFREVIDRQDQKLNRIAVTGDKTHLLCNSAMMAQKKMVAEALKDKAGETKSKIDILAAERAWSAYEEHKASQEELDKKDKDDIALTIAAAEAGKAPMEDVIAVATKNKKAKKKSK